MLTKPSPYWIATNRSSRQRNASRPCRHCVWECEVIVVTRTSPATHEHMRWIYIAVHIYVCVCTCVHVYVHLCKLVYYMFCLRRDADVWIYPVLHAIFLKLPTWYRIFPSHVCHGWSSTKVAKHTVRQNEPSQNVTGNSLLCTKPKLWRGSVLNMIGP